VYKDNSTGYSPSEDGYGLSASDIKVDLLAVNEASYFHLDHDTSLWDPSRTTSSSVGMVMLDKASASTAITIDEPIVTAVESGLGRSFQTGYIWVNNPLAVTVPVTVTQPLVPEFTLLDPGSGVQESNSVVWGDHIDPLDTIMFTYTFVTGDFPGTDLMLPAAELIIQNPSGGNISVTSDPVPFSLPWPITISRKTPEWIPPETAATITVTATNQMDENVSGSFRVDVETSEGISVQSTTQPLALSAKQSQSLTFDLPATLDIGDYLFTGSLQVQGEHTVVFKDPFSVGARSPYLATTISPVAPDGTVEAGATLTCEVLVENSASIKLTNVVVSSSIPAGVDLISMSSGGISVNNRIQWDNQEVLPGASKTYTFVIHIPEHFVMKGEEHYIHSVPTLTSNESPDTTGFAATVVVIDNQKRKVYLPVTVDSPIAP
jgi:uncharacterized repeat protein (TIGR01451 family)